MKRLLSFCLLFAIAIPAAAQDTKETKDPQWIVYQPLEQTGKTKKIVLVSGDEEYRSEEMLPQLGKILARRHGFDCSVHFALDKNGIITPGSSNIPGLEALKDADLLVIFTRFRNLPDDQMKYLVDYIESGKPIVGLRTATHAFSIPKGREYHKYTWNNGDPMYKGGFGRHVLGETWVNHHGGHGSQASRGIIAKGAENHPILRGIKNGDIFGPTDVYTASPLPDSNILVLGQVVNGMKFDDPPLEGKKNDPMQPIAWTRLHKNADGKEARVFCSTLANGQDFLYEGTRRMTVNACLWALGLEDRIGEKTNVDFVGEYSSPSFREGARKGIRPADHMIK